MNIFMKIGEILFKIIASILVLLALILEYLSSIKTKNKECKYDTNKRKLKVIPFKNTQSSKI